MKIKPLLDFLVTPLNGQRYDNISKKGNKKLIISTSQEDHTTTNRVATVLETPVGYEGKVNVGDNVIVHHNIFRRFYNMKGVEESGPCHFKDDLYLVPNEQIYFYFRDNKWNSTGRYCFIKPIEKEKGDLLSLDKHEELLGKIHTSNKYLDDLGLDKDDIVVFSPDVEYEFKIDDEILYRVDSRKICVTI